MYFFIFLPADLFFFTEFNKLIEDMIFLSVATDKFCFVCVKPTNAFYAAALHAKIDIRGGALVQQDDPEAQILPST